MCILRKGMHWRTLAQTSEKHPVPLDPNKPYSALSGAHCCLAQFGVDWSGSGGSRPGVSSRKAPGVVCSEACERSRAVRVRRFWCNIVGGVGAGDGCRTGKQRFKGSVSSVRVLRGFRRVTLLQGVSDIEVSGSNIVAATLSGLGMMVPAHCWLWCFISRRAAGPQTPWSACAPFPSYRFNWLRARPVKTSCWICFPKDSVQRQLQPEFLKHCHLEGQCHVTRGKDMCPSPLGIHKRPLDNARKGGTKHCECVA